MDACAPLLADGNSAMIGRRLQALNVVDDFSRECLARVVDTSLSGSRVVLELEALMARQGSLS